MFRLCMIGILWSSSVFAADFSSYRGLHFGMPLATAAEQSGTRLTEARIVHQKPAVIQELDWRPRAPITKDPLKVDPVKEGVLNFYNGELFRIVVTYDRYRIEGMTTEDVIQGISATYGTPAKPTVEIPFHSNYGESAAVLARWEDPEYSYDLVRTGDRASYSLVLYSKRLEAMAQAAIVQAVRIEAQEAPQREIDRQAQRANDEMQLLEKARLANKPNFQP
jgi:hypothetical protein